MAPSSSSFLCLPSPSLSVQPRNRRSFRLPPASRFPGCGPSVRPHRLSSSSSSSLLLSSSFSSSSSELSRTVRLRCTSQRPSADESELELDVERLFSNLNRATLKREPGSLSSAVFLVVGTTAATGLLIAKVNVNTMRELGSGGVLLVSIAIRTIGKFGVQVAW